MLVTDADGEVLLDMISAYMKKNLPREAAEEIRQRYINQNDMKNNTTNVEETIDQAKESIESARAEKEKTKITLSRTIAAGSEAIKITNTPSVYDTLGMTEEELEAIKADLQQ